MAKANPQKKANSNASATKSSGIPPARRLAVMNLGLRGIEAGFGPEHADTFRRDLHPDLRADYGLVAKVLNEVHAWINKGYDGAPADHCPNNNPAASRIRSRRARGHGLRSGCICS